MTEGEKSLGSTTNLENCQPHVTTTLFPILKYKVCPKIEVKPVELISNGWIRVDQVWTPNT